MKTPRNTSETTGFHLSHHLLFMQIRQIFDHIQPSENKVFLTLNQNFRKFLFFNEKTSFFLRVIRHLRTCGGSKEKLRVVTPLDAIFWMVNVRAQKQVHNSIANFVRLAVANNFLERSTEQETKNSSYRWCRWIRNQKLSRKDFFLKILEPIWNCPSRIWGEKRNFSPTNWKKTPKLNFLNESVWRSVVFRRVVFFLKKVWTSLQFLPSKTCLGWGITGWGAYFHYFEKITWGVVYTLYPGKTKAFT